MKKNLILKQGLRIMKQNTVILNQKTFEVLTGTIENVKVGDYIPNWRGIVDYEEKSYNQVIGIRPAEVGRDCAMVLVEAFGPHVMITHANGAVENSYSIWACSKNVTILRSDANVN